MSSVTQSGTESSVRRSSTAVRRIGALILAIIGLLLIAAGLIYVVEPAGSLPSFLGHIAGSTGHRPLHMMTAFVVGVALLALAGWAGFSSKARRD